jgi:hypothetical protein
MMFFVQFHLNIQHDDDVMDHKEFEINGIEDSLTLKMMKMLEARILVIHIKYSFRVNQTY